MSGKHTLTEELIAQKPKWATITERALFLCVATALIFTSLCLITYSSKNNTADKFEETVMFAVPFTQVSLQMKNTDYLEGDSDWFFVNGQRIEPSQEGDTATLIFSKSFGVTEVSSEHHLGQYGDISEQEHFDAYVRAGAR